MIEALRDPVCGYAASTGLALGYGRENPDEDSGMAKRLKKTQKSIPKRIAGLNAAIAFSNDIADEFDKELHAGVGMADLSGLFTSAISEAIVQTLIDKSERCPEGMILDAVVFKDNNQVTRRNVDFFYCPHDEPIEAEAYECKNDPSSVFFDALGLPDDSASDKKVKWAASKLYFMEHLKHLLESKGIPTHLGLISLRTEDSMLGGMRKVARRTGQQIPELAAVYAREHIFTDIPNCRQQPVWSNGQ